MGGMATDELKVLHKIGDKATLKKVEAGVSACFFLSGLRYLSGR